MKRQSPAPKGLGKRGKAFWKAVMERYDAAPIERELLLEAARTMDVLEDMDDPREARAQRMVLSRLLAQLNLPDLGYARGFVG